MLFRSAAEPQKPCPVIPIVLTSEKPAEKVKEITDRLEQGITELFDSERYKEYLKVMSRFHNYSFNNTLFIAIQKPDASLVAGFTAWKNNFQRNVMKGENGIKIFAQRASNRLNLCNRHISASTPFISSMSSW